MTLDLKALKAQKTTRKAPLSKALREIEMLIFRYRTRGSPDRINFHKSWLNLDEMLAALGPMPEGSYLERKNQDLPHGPGNSFWSNQEDPPTKAEAEAEAKAEAKEKAKGVSPESKRTQEARAYASKIFGRPL